MKQQPIENEAEFVRSLDRRQRAYFLRRESENASRLQAALVDLARGMSAVSAMNGESLQLILAEPT
jgi:hypothetical protein